MGDIFDGAAFSTQLSQAQFFCEVLHSEVVRIQRDSNHQDLAFFRMLFATFGRKKGEAEAGALYTLRWLDWIFGGDTSQV